MRKSDWKVRWESQMGKSEKLRKKVNNTFLRQPSSRAFSKATSALILVLVLFQVSRDSFAWEISQNLEEETSEGFELPERTEYTAPFLSRKTYLITDLLIEGASRTDTEWLKSYVGYIFPGRYQWSDFEEIRRKVLTTGAFHRVSVDPVDVQGKTYLRLRISEKWTTIPVARAELGGGTPMYVAGVYDIHSLGRLITMGAEARQYGEEDPGYTVWVKSPRHGGGKYDLGLEFWDTRRLRTLYDRDGEAEGELRDIGKRVRLYVLSDVSKIFGTSDTSRVFERIREKVSEHESQNETVDERKLRPDSQNAALRGKSGRHPPLTNPFQKFPKSAPSPTTSNFKLGFDLIYSVRDSSTVTSFRSIEPSNSSEILGIEGSDDQKSTKLMATSIYDDVDIDNYDYDGLRVILKSGGVFSQEAFKRHTRIESFYYETFFPVTLAARLRIDARSGKTPDDILYLGGFGAVRGYPDGIERGNHQYIGNFEARHIGLRYEKVLFQFVGWFDVGAAGFGASGFSSPPRKSFGGGLRIASPQIHRLMLRIDYGRSVDGKFSGITLGLNQFFQPYRPL